MGINVEPKVIFYKSTHNKLKIGSFLPHLNYLKGFFPNHTAISFQYYEQMCATLAEKRQNQTSFTIGSVTYLRIRGFGKFLV